MSDLCGVPSHRITKCVILLGIYVSLEPFLSFPNFLPPVVYPLSDIFITEHGAPLS